MTMTPKCGVWRAEAAVRGETWRGVAWIGALGLMSVKRDLDAVAKINNVKMRIDYEPAEEL